MSLLRKLKDTFGYQIDVVIPNYETNFVDLIEDVCKRHEYFLLTKVSLDELIDPNFINKFVKNGNLKEIFKIMKIVYDFTTVPV